MPGEYLLGVDIGTYSSKGVLVDNATGETIAMYTVEHSLSMPKPGWVEHDPDKVWWGEFVEICRQLITQSKIDPGQIKGIGTSAIGPCVLPIGASGKPLRQAILYGIDTRSFKEIEELEQAIGKEKIFNTAGSHLSTQAAGPKVLWIKNNEPEVYKRTKYFLTSQAYIVYKLTRQATIDIYTAGGYAPLIDNIKYEWSAEMAKYVAPLDTMPKLFWSCEVVGGVTPEAAKETGLAEGTPVITGTTDAAAEAISAGVADIGDMMMMFGSSIFFILKTEKLAPTEHFWSSNWLEKGTYAFLGGMSTAGSLTRWFRDNLAPVEVAAQNASGENAYAAMAKMLTQSPLGANGLIALPYFEGERTPLHDPNAKGVLFGLTLKHTRADIYRAILEGVSFGIRHNVDSMRAEGVVPKRILGVGGGTKNLEWMQMVSDIANIEMVIPEQQIGASYGDAFMAGVGVGKFKNLSEITKWVKSKHNIKPNADRNKKYEPLYKIYRELYTQTAPLMHELSRMYRG